jgi:hypothetical protein
MRLCTEDKPEPNGDGLELQCLCSLVCMRRIYRGFTKLFDSGIHRFSIAGSVQINGVPVECPLIKLGAGRS